MAKFNNLESRDWNDNQGFLQRLDLRFNECDEAANSGMIITWYRSLRTMYRKIHNKISADEFKIKYQDPKTSEETESKVDEYLILLFTQAKNKISEMNQNYGNKLLTQQFQTFSITDAEQILDEIDKTLSDLYVKYYIRLDALSQDPRQAVREVFRN